MHPRAIMISGTIVSLVISAILYLVFASRAKEAQAFTKVNILYLLGASLSFMIIGLTGYFGLKEKTSLFFDIYQFAIFVLGILHVILFRKILPWNNKVEFYWRLFFTVNIMLFGIFFLLLSYRIINYKISSFLILTSVLWFIIPILYVEMVEKYLSLPKRIFKEWIYPADKKIAIPTEYELSSPFVISFRFKKKGVRSKFTELKAKAPAHLQFGKLYYFFIEDYVDKMPEERVDFIDKADDPYRWIFYHRRGLFRLKFYIDPKISVEQNLLKENSMVHCIRIVDDKKGNITT